MSGKSTVPKESIEAASRTYVRCTNLLCERFGVSPPDRGLGPRETFEATVTRLQEMLVNPGEEASGSHLERTEEDFSFNEVLRMMKKTVCTCIESNDLLLTREEFIRRVNATLEEEGGLKFAGRLVPKAQTGRYAWIEEHMQTFLRRNSDVVRRSKSFPDSLRIGGRREP